MDINHPLPWRITSDEDIFALNKRFGATVFLTKGNFRKMRALIEPDESLYFVTAVATVFIVPAGTMPSAGEKSLWDIFISNRRVLFRNEANEVRHIPIQDIVSINFNRKSVVFSAGETWVTFEPMIDTSAVYNAFAQALSEAGVAVEPWDEMIAKHTASSQRVETQTQAQAAATAVECPGCGDVVNVVAGQTSECEYCGRRVSA